MKRSLFDKRSVQNGKEDGPILLVDREGVIGKHLLERLQQDLPEWPIVFVGNARIPVTQKNLKIPFVGRIPHLPNATYSLIFIVITGDKETDIMVPELLKKAKIDKARCIVLLSPQLYTKAFKETVFQEYSQTSVLLYGDIFGSDIPFDMGTAIGRFLLDVNKKKRIILCHDGLKNTYPVSITDIIANVIVVTFRERTGGLYFLFQKNPPTELHLAHIFHRLDPLVTIDYLKKHDCFYYHDVYDIPANGTYLLEERYPLQKRIQEAEILTDAGHVTKQEPLHAIKKQKSNKKTIFPPFLFLLFLGILPFLATCIFLIGGALFLVGAKSGIEQGKFSMAVIASDRAAFFFAGADKTSQVFTEEEALFGRTQEAAVLQQAVKEGNDVSSATGYLTHGLAAFSQIINQPKNAQKELTTVALNDLKSSLLSFQQIVAEQKDTTQQFFPFHVIASADQIAKLLKVAQTVSFFGNFIDITPELLGFNGKKEYLMLFQNNMELRPGGGFIGSYGILKMDRGVISEFSVHDVYDADGQLRGHVEPPFAIRRYLPSVHLFLRDSNFALDFNQGASTSAFLFNQETNETPDGIIAVDVSFVKTVLAAIGPVTVPDYSETVTADTVFPLLQVHAEKNFFPGSTQKKDFMRSLLLAMQQKIFASGQVPYMGLLDASYEGMRQKHILFSFADPSIQNLFTVNNLSSSLWDPRVSDDSHLNDFIGINEANLGVNKANYFVKRSLSQHSTIDEQGNVTDAETIAYVNNSVSWPGGIYKEYLRVIVPQGSHFESITIDGKLQDVVPAITNPAIYEAKKFVAPQQLELETTTESGKTVFGFLTTVPAKGKQTIVVTYMPPFHVTIGQAEFFYNLRMFKQPGTGSDPIAVTVTYPQEYSLIASSEEVTKHDMSATLLTDNEQDRDLNLHFSSK